VEPDAGVNELAYQLVLAHEDAALGVVACVAGMDAYAGAVRKNAYFCTASLKKRKSRPDQRPVARPGASDGRQKRRCPQSANDTNDKGSGSLLMRNLNKKTALLLRI